LAEPVKLNPVRYWNQLEITCRSDTVEVMLNGHSLGKLSGAGMRKGFIALRCKGQDMYFRNIELRELPPSPPEPAFVPLFNGKDLDGLVGYANADKPLDPKKLWDMNSGLVIYKGLYRGYLRTTEKYRNFVLKLDYRYPLKAQPSGASGLFLHMTGPDKESPSCSRVALSTNGGN